MLLPGPVLDPTVASPATSVPKPPTPPASEKDPSGDWYCQRDWADEFHRVDVQVLRSCGPWSIGVDKPERSIYNAYIDAIMGARSMIYIENQFFVSSRFALVLQRQCPCPCAQRCRSGLTRGHVDVCCVLLA